MVRLTVSRSAWLQHVRATAEAYGPALVPVVKGNGYGFGRPTLHDVVADGLGMSTGDASRTVCVGSVAELGAIDGLLFAEFHRPEPAYQALIQSIASERILMPALIKVRTALIPASRPAGAK